MSSTSLTQVYPSAYNQRPRSAGSRSSSFLNLSPLPEDVDISLGDVPSVSRSFDSVGADQEKHEHLEMKNRSEKMTRPVTAPEMSIRAQSPHLRSAKYLASQWRSRATQWSASSSMRNFKETSSLPSSPPPPLSEHDSDSDSCGKSTTSLDESIQSRVSDAHSVLEPWKNRADSNCDNQSLKTVKTGNKDTSGGDDNDDAYDDAEFSPEDISKSFGFALKVPEKDDNTKRIQQHVSKEITEDYKSPPDPSQNSHRHQRIPRETWTNTKVQTPDWSDTSPRSVVTTNSIDSSLPHDQQILRDKKKEILNSTKGEKRDMATHATSKVVSTKEKSIHLTSTDERSSHKHLQKTRNSPQQKLQNSSKVEIRPATEPTRWAQYEVIFTFSLLTSPERAPPIGVYIPEDEVCSFKEKLQHRSKLLYAIMGKFATTLQKIKSLSNEKGKYMMCPRDCTPTTRFVQRDGMSNTYLLLFKAAVAKCLY